MIDEFYVKNIEKKRGYLQNEHEIILDAIFQNAMEHNCIQQFSFNSEICQCMAFSEIKEKTGMDLQVMYTCLRDLESMGFVLNVMLNPNKEYSYAITWLGLKYKELKSNSSSIK